MSLSDLSGKRQWADLVPVSDDALRCAFSNSRVPELPLRPYLNRYDAYKGPTITSNLHTLHISCATATTAL